MYKYFFFFVLFIISNLNIAAQIYNYHSSIKPFYCSPDCERINEEDQFDGPKLAIKIVPGSNEYVMYVDKIEKRGVFSISDYNNNEITFDSGCLCGNKAKYYDNRKTLILEDNNGLSMTFCVTCGMGWPWN